MPPGSLNVRTTGIRERLGTNAGSVLIRYISGEQHQKKCSIMAIRHTNNSVTAQAVTKLHDGSRSLHHGMAGFRKVKINGRIGELFGKDNNLEESLKKSRNASQSSNRVVKTHLKHSTPSEHAQNRPHW